MKRPRKFTQTTPSTKKNPLRVRQRTSDVGANILKDLDNKKRKSCDDISITPAEEIFCREYIRLRNVKKAAIAANLTDKEENASARGSSLLKQPRIMLRLQQLWEDEKQRLQLNGGDILQELVRIATADINDFISIDSRGNIKLREKFDGRVVKGIESYIDGNGERRLKLTFWDKDRALENLGKHYKLFTELFEETHKVQVFKIGDTEIEF